MEDRYSAYLDLLGELKGTLETLTQLAQRKAEAVHQNDLLALDEVIKQEQAISLTLRGYEQKRVKLLSQLELEQVPLSKLAEHYPEPLRPRAKEASEGLRRAYRIYHSAAEAAKGTLSLHLHEIDEIIAASGVDLGHGAGYTPPSAEPPKNMKTDFRA